ncbi:hypothetical protein [Streptomyces europaeiscabiei]|uniref:hypothetical protein n=1 Tax=Streptomyces europaeiscabiei TaxID=146819 RepID=UPI002E17880C
MSEHTERAEPAAKTPSTVQWARAAARRISRGSSRLVWLLGRRISRRGVTQARRMWRGIVAWLGEASGFDWLLRAAILVVGGLLAKHFAPDVALVALRILEAASAYMWAAAVVWTIAAYRVGAKDWTPPTDDQDGEQQPEPVEAAADGAQPAPTAEQPLPTREQLAVALHEIGAPHAQFVPLAERLGVDTARVRAACRAAGIPTRDGVRMKGRSSAAGVARSDFPPLPSPAEDPSSASLLAAATSNNNDNNAATAGPEGVHSFVITDDATNPYRHLVHHFKKG